MGDESDFLYGTLDLLLLRALSHGPQHGYGVVEWIRARTRDAIVVDEAALYKALHRMEHRGLLRSEWGASENNRRAKFYHVTRRGAAKLRGGSQAWRRFATAVERVLDAT